MSGVRGRDPVEPGVEKAGERWDEPGVADMMMNEGGREGEGGGRPAGRWGAGGRAGRDGRELNGGGLARAEDGSGKGKEGAGGRLSAGYGGW